VGRRGAGPRRSLRYVGGVGPDDSVRTTFRMPQATADSSTENVIATFSRKILAGYRRVNSTPPEIAAKCTI